MVANIEKNLDMLFGIVKDPERFLVETYYKSNVPKGFRIEFYVAKRYNSICDNLKQFSELYLKLDDCENRKCKTIGLFPIKKIKAIIGNVSKAKHQKKTFCPFCEKLVIPRRIHKLDYGDVVLALFTGGFWLIFIIVIYIFLRRCPICNYSLRGMKPSNKR